jgi:hypothetical protein
VSHKKFEQAFQFLNFLNPEPYRLTSIPYRRGWDMNFAIASVRLLT